MVKKWQQFNESKKKTYKQSDLTEEMLDEWIENYRKVFGDELKDSMDLIAFGIRSLDDPKSKNKEKWKKRLWEFFENDLANKKKLLCDKCGSPMEVYYTVHCFRCEKPEPKDNELNYFLCVNWLEKNEEDFDEDELWDYLSNDVIQGNDTYCKLPSSSNDSNMKIFMKHFDTKKTKYFVSW
jgi:hypothetical protein